MCFLNRVEEGGGKEKKGQNGIALLTEPLTSTGTPSIFFPVSVMQQPHSKAAGQKTTAEMTPAANPRVGPTTLQ